MVPEASRAHCLRQVIAGGHHGLPDRLHGLDEQLIDPVCIGFGIERPACRLSRIQRSRAACLCTTQREVTWVLAMRLSQSAAQGLATDGPAMYLG